VLDFLEVSLWSIAERNACPSQKSNLKRGPLCLLHVSCWLLARLTPNPEDGGSRFLRNVAKQPNYTILHSSR
jgi:hypothetical protein